MNLLRTICIKHADGRIVEGELLSEIRIPNEHHPFERVSDFHIRAIAHFQPIQAKMLSGVVLSMTPSRVEAKVGDKALPPLVTIESADQIWETFWADISGITTPQR